MGSTLRATGRHSQQLKLGSNSPLAIAGLVAAMLGVTFSGGTARRLAFSTNRGAGY